MEFLASAALLSLMSAPPGSILTPRYFETLQESEDMGVFTERQPS